MTATLFLSLASLLIIGVPIAYALGISTVLTAIIFGLTPTDLMAQKLFYNLSGFTLLAIPFFVLAGNLMSSGGIARRLVNMANAFVGHYYGGLAMAGILASAIFASISGSSPATLLAIGSILIPTMKKMGYSNTFSVGALSTAGTLGIMIPPSIPLITYAIVTEQSAGKLFQAGILPGILTAILLMGTSYVVARKKNIHREEPTPLPQKWQAFRDAFSSLLIPVIVLGGIYGGAFTPTEAGAVAVALGIIFGVFIYKEITLKSLPKIIMESAKTTGMLYLIIAMALLFSFVLTMEQIPQQIAESIVSITDNKWLILLLINILLLIAGVFLDAIAAILILTPVLYPIILEFGIDPIHFGIIMILNLEIGMLTPPVGLNLYVASKLTGLGISEVVKATLPWILVLLTALLLVTYIPQISLFFVQ
jgi:C4-dicarboxylate transporter DctM subunit